MRDPHVIDTVPLNKDNITMSLRQLFKTKLTVLSFLWAALAL